MGAWETEENFRARFGHSSLCNCVRWWKGRLIVTVRHCDCVVAKKKQPNPPATPDPQAQ